MPAYHPLRAFLSKNLRASRFSEGISNEPNVCRINLAGHSVDSTFNAKRKSGRTRWDLSTEHLFGRASLFPVHLNTNGLGGISAMWRVQDIQCLVYFKKGIHSKHYQSEKPTILYNFDNKYPSLQHICVDAWLINHGA